MSDAKKSRTTSSAGRRLRLSMLAVAFLSSVLASVVLSNVIMSRVPSRVDVTSLAIHNLSPRTKNILGSLTGEHEIVLAGPWSDPAGRAGLDPKVVRQVIDTLNEIGRQSEDLRVTVIDTASDTGNSRFLETVDRLVERDRVVLEDQQRVIGEAVEEIALAATRAGQFKAAIDAFVPAFDAADPTSAQFQGLLVNLSQGVESLALDLDARRQAAQTAIDTPAFGGQIGQIDEADRIADAALSRSMREFEAIAPTLEAIASSPSTPEVIADRLPPLARTISSWRDDAARARDELQRVERSDVMRIGRALSQASVALVIGPDDLTAIAMDSLFPGINPAEQGEGLVADLRGHTESIVTLALAALSQTQSPIVIFMHGNPTATLFESGAIDNLRRDLGSRRIDAVEWAVVLDRSRPSLAELDPTGTRSVVHVVIATDPGVSMGDDPALSGPSRAKTLAETTKRLLDDGESVLLSLMPSLAGIHGGVDDLAQTIEPFGLRARNTTPILLDSQGQDGRVVQAIAGVLRADSGHLIADAMGALPTTLRWSSPIELIDGSGAVAHPLLEIDEPNAWAESEFQDIWAQRAGGSVAWMGEGLPEASPMRSDDVEGPWTVAWAASRPGPNGGTQRLVVVGANGWFFDRERAGTTRVQGVTVAQNPGNAQLFESSLLWLTDQDELIAQGPSARAVARLGEISPAQSRAIAWGLIAVMPLGVLLIGLFWRLIRG